MSGELLSGSLRDLGVSASQRALLLLLCPWVEAVGLVWFYSLVLIFCHFLFVRLVAVSRPTQHRLRFTDSIARNDFESQSAFRGEMVTCFVIETDTTSYELGS